MIALLGYAVLWKYAAWIIFGCFVIWALKDGVRTWILWRADRRKRLLDEAAERECLIARANYENQQWQEAGIYEGRYPAATMPLTGEVNLEHLELATDPIEPVEWYDYDDLTDPPDWSGVVKPK